MRKRINEDFTNFIVHARILQVKAAKNRRRLAATDKDLETQFLEGLKIQESFSDEEPSIEVPPEALTQPPFLMR